MSSTTTTLTASATDLFPTVTASSVTNNNQQQQNPTTYYFVFLGVLLILLLAAACLALRAYRLRRRYRTARQLAIARGEPVPPLRDEYWGLGGLSAWTQDGLDRMHGGPSGAAGTDRDGKNKGVWREVPKLRDVVLGEDDLEETVGEKGVGMEDVQPITLHSLLPAPPAPSQSHPSHSPPVPIQLMGPRPRIHPLFDMYGPGPGPSTGRHSRDLSHLITPLSGPSEIDRLIQPGEDVRVAVIIQMPTEGDNVVEEDEEPVGWQSGMEMGVWEGTVSLSALESRSETVANARSEKG